MHVISEATNYLKNWIKDFLDRPHSAFNGYSPCPFAKKSLDDRKVIFLSCTEKTFPASISMAGYDVVVYVFEDNIDPDTLSDLAQRFNRHNSHLAALEDHPFEEERVQDCVLNNGKYCTIFIQARSKLKKFRNTLKKTSYYDNWSPEYVEDVINR